MHWLHRKTSWTPPDMARFRSEKSSQRHSHQTSRRRIAPLAQPIEEAMKLVVSLSALMPKAALCASLGAASALLAAPATAATLKRFDDRLVLTGAIERFDDVIFAAAAADRDVRVLVLGSSGGDVETARSIGEIVRARHLEVIVPSACESACSLMARAGVGRSGSGTLLLHCPRLGGASECYEPARKEMAAYLRKMGAPAKLVELQATADMDGTRIGPEEWQEQDEPPRRRPPQYLPPPVPPGYLVDPYGQRLVPCLPQLLGLRVFILRCTRQIQKCASSGALFISGMGRWLPIWRHSKF